MCGDKDSCIERGCHMCRTRGEHETRREALLRELHDLEAKLNPLKCALTHVTAMGLINAPHTPGLAVLTHLDFIAYAFF